MAEKLANVIDNQTSYYRGIRSDRDASHCEVNGFPDTWGNSGFNSKEVRLNMDRNHHSACCNTNSNTGVRQSLAEVDFERGIWYAAQNNDLDRVKMLLNKGVSASAEDAAGYTALHYAARNGHYEVCKTLLENNAAVEAQTRCGRATALHRAATQAHVNIVELLLKSGANANLRDADGYTALHRALLARSERVCQLLIPRTDFALLTDCERSIKQLAKDNCPNVLPLLSTLDD